VRIYQFPVDSSFLTNQGISLLIGLRENIFAVNHRCMNVHVSMAKKWREGGRGEQRGGDNLGSY